VALSAGLAACGAPDYRYVKSTKDRTFVRLPADWQVFDEDQLLENSTESAEAKEQFKQLTWSVAFDAAPKPSPENVLSVSSHPSGLVQVRTLSPAQRDAFSLADLRSLLLQFDPLAENSDEASQVEVLASNDVERPGGLHGSEMLLNIQTPGGDVVKWRQIALIDSSVERVHVLAVSCDAECYDKNESVIDRVVESWKVKER